jgi:hypothetical protein
MRTTKTSLVLLAVLAALPGCSLYIDGELRKAQALVNEGEGEGDGREGEGEGEEGEGEGEIAEGEGEIDDTDPACEAEERLLVVRADSTDVMRVYDLAEGGMRRRFPQGVTTNLNLDNDDPVAGDQGFELNHVAIGSDDRLFMIGDRFLYQLEASTLTQQEIGGRTQLVLESFASVDHVEVLNNFILPIGPDIKVLAQDAEVGATASVLHDGDEYLGTTTFSTADGKFVAASAEYGYVVVGAFGDAPPEVVTSVDTEFDTARIHGFSRTPKGIAFDASTQQLLLGDLSRVIVMRAADNFQMPASADGDYILPGDNDSIDVAGIAARGGFAWLLLRRSNDNLVKLDLSTSPPRAVDIATVDVSSFGSSIVVGCQRVFIANYEKVVAVSRDTLATVGTLPLTSVARIRLVQRSALGLVGDD